MHEYQLFAYNHIVNKKHSALFLDMGLGKTIITLTAIAELRSFKLIEKVLIICPLRVANTVWQQEAKKWFHTSDINVVICTGSKANREKKIKQEADVYLVNRENTNWIVEQIEKKVISFDMIVIDESTSFKNYNSKRFLALKKILKDIEYRVILTGTPSPNGYMDLWSQMYIVDRGERLGKYITYYRNDYFTRSPYCVHVYNIKPYAQEVINNLISDVTISLQARDFLDMPEKITIDYKVDLDNKAYRTYYEIQEDFFTELGDNQIMTPNVLTQLNKLLQCCNGNIYNDDGDTIPLHTNKLDALAEIIEDNPNENILLAYRYTSDLNDIKKRFKEAVVLSKSAKELDAWNRGEIKLLVAHPASAGHGLNAQHGGSIVVWYGLDYSLELYQQFNGRLYRQGQKNTVRIVHLVAEDTLELSILEVLQSKDMTQQSLLDHLRVSR
ncbi:hypothetical protein AB832_06580 [Flavobacteriaceae bacterium (ex Bugula neritina AB1)]|nr:hypothetical protein AB832_06580 [Flavobacteriaceae bacterium (ex Bugula neritina AB1)]